MIMDLISKFSIALIRRFVLQVASAAPGNPPWKAELRYVLKAILLFELKK